jgi:hypothetical protein
VSCSELRQENIVGSWFKDAVLSNFEFLHTYGLKPVEEDVTFVRYESDAAFVNVYHGRGSFEIGVEIGRLDRAEKYGLDYIVLLGRQAGLGIGGIRPWNDVSGKHARRGS